MFLIKKILAQFLMPLSLGLAISYLGLFLLLFTSKQKSGKFLALFGILAITLLSLDPISDLLLKPIEDKYPSYENSRPSDFSGLKYIVVLGAGHTSDKNLPITSQINTSALTRLIEAIRIHRQHPESKLLLSGGGIFDPVSNAEIMAEVARAIGVDENDIVIEAESWDTKDEARIIKPIVGSDPFILLTSASHMPRSVAIFKHLGMDPIPVSAHHLVKKRSNISPGTFFPSIGALDKSERVFYEHIGFLWAKLRKQV